MGEKKLPSAGPAWVIELHDPERPQRGDAPLDERARRRRRRWLVGVPLALVISYVLALGIDTLITGTPSPPAQPAPPAAPLHVRTGATLAWALDSLHVINADTGASRTLPMPAPAGASGDEMVAARGSLLLNRGERAWLYRPGLAQAPVNLGTSARTIVTPSGNGVWLWDTGPFNDPGMTDGVRQVDFTGHQVGSTVAVPANWFLTGEAVDRGLVLAPRLGGPTEIWDPSSGKVVQSAPPYEEVVAAQGNLLAWVTAEETPVPLTTPTARRYVPGSAVTRCRLHCILHITDLKAGTDRAIALPSGVWPLGAVFSGAEFSPDGATLAVSGLLGRFMIGKHPANEHFAQTGEVVVVVDLARGTAKVLPGSKRPYTVQRLLPLFWSPNGWLFFTDYGSPYVEAWQPGIPTAGVLPKVRLPHLPPPGPQGQRLPSLIAITNRRWVASSPSSIISR